jgi:thiol-disulfide isomerase/thioredoxin
MKIKKPQVYNLLLLVFIVLMILPQTRKPIQIGVHSILGLFSPSIKNIEDRTQISTYNWQLLDVNSHQFDFNKTKGKVVFVNLWATWCPPCIAEMPNMQKIYQDYGDKVTFLFVSNEKSTKVSVFLNKKNLTIPAYYPITNNPKEISSTSIPATYIIDKKGFIVVEKIGVANWNSDVVRELLDQLLSE